MARPTPPPVRVDFAQFQDFRGGRRDQDAAIIFTQGGGFIVPVKIERAGLYDVAICARNSRPGPVNLNVVNPDEPAVFPKPLAEFSFGKNDDSWSTQTQQVHLTPEVQRLSVNFTNDYAGPDGDRNAVVASVTLQAHVSRR